MTSPTTMRIRDGELFLREARALPPPPPELPPRPRTEGIVQAILTWLDAQL